MQVIEKYFVIFLRFVRRLCHYFTDHVTGTMRNFALNTLMVSESWDNANVKFINKPYINLFALDPLRNTLFFH